MNHDIALRAATAADIPALEAVIRGIGLFTVEEADGFAATLPGHFEEPVDPASGGARVWLLAEDGAGAAYLSPEPSPGVWNLLFLGVRPEARRRGVARALIGEVERRLRRDGARMLLIDTSSLPAMAAARALYPALGYERVAEIPDYWAPGDAKITYLRRL